MKKTTIEVDIADIIKEIRDDQKLHISETQSLNIRVQKNEDEIQQLKEAVLELKGLSGSMKDMLLVHSKVIEKYDMQERTMGMHAQDILSIKNDFNEVRTSVKTSFYWIKSFGIALVAISSLFTFAFKSFVTNIVIETDKNFIKEEILSLLEKYNIQVNEIPNSK